MPSQGGKSKEQKKNAIFLKEGRLSAQPRGKTQKTTNNKQKQEKRESRPKHVQ